MNLPKNFTNPGLIGLAAVFVWGAAGCQHGGGYTADQRDPIGPAPAAISSPGIGAPGGQSVDTRGTGTVTSSEGSATLAGPAAPFTSSGTTR